MKEFVIKELEKFLDISDSISTPFKFYEIQEVGEKKQELNAKVWLRTAFISFQETIVEEEGLQSTCKTLQDHGFVLTEIRESPMVLR